jgi:hypothetical protein
VNGALQVRGQDYTASNGTSVVMSSALAVNDVVEIFAYTAFTVANAYTKSETDGIAAAAAGLRMVVPSSISVGSGSGSANAAGYVTFSGVSSLSLNGIFSSLYDSYRLVINLDPNATGYSSITGRLRTSGTDASGSNYSFYGMYVDSGGGPARDAGTNITSMSIADSNTGGGLSTVDVVNPFVAKRTFFNITRNNATSANTGYQLFLVGGCHNVTTSYDGLTLNFTYSQSGTIAVYGYKD